MKKSKIYSQLELKKIKPGDKVRILKEGKTYEGLLMPRIELGDPECIILKLANGYNIGIDSKEAKVEKLESGKTTLKETLKPLKTDPGKQTVSILSCGGTIVSKIEYKTGGVFPSFEQSEIVKSFPKVQEIVNLKTKKLFDLLSEDMTPEHWKVIAKETADQINSGSAGIVLMHGTDTMHYTSAALSFMLQDLPVPVVLVGAQRSSDRGSSDNYQNLLCAIRTATSDIAEVSICMHANSSDDFCFVHQGTKARKMHTSRRDAFRSINALPFAKVWENGKIEYLRTDYNKRSNKKVKPDLKVNPNVCLVQIHPGIKPEFIKSLSKFYDGVVLTATGIGNVPANPFGDKFAKSIIPAVKSLIDSGVPVVIAPQTIYGRIQTHIYTAGILLEETGAIGNYCDWTPETAFVKLMFALGHSRDLTEIKKIMLTNIAGEITERSLPETFLY
ncbi:MAG TPA: Glu-tRNA(Gln) amidotransferase subunit GatD [archaeon]|nr:Glu-tRNA(Gln) amidotransferase subunit GatD [archaeon]